MSNLRTLLNNNIINFEVKAELVQDNSKLENKINGIAFSNDGFRVSIVGKQNNKVHNYVMTTAFDLTTASYESKFDPNPLPSNQEFTGLRTIAFNNDGTKFFLGGEYEDATKKGKIIEYAVNETIFGNSYYVAETTQYTYT